MSDLLNNRKPRPVSGVGIGLRDPHFDRLIHEEHDVPWVELLADNYLSTGGLTARQVDMVKEQYPLTLHCVGMNLGGVDPLDFDYLGKIRDLMQRSEPAWISDHLCFTRFGQSHYHDLLPLPYSAETLLHVSKRIEQVQDFLDTRLLIENASAYIKADTPMSEAQFLKALTEECDCDLLLDVNNLYVNQVNLGEDAELALETIPLERVREIHLAGFEDKGRYLIDAHNNPVSQPVWDLFENLVSRLKNPAVLIEWDNNIPELEVLLGEAHKAASVLKQTRQAVA